MCEQTQIAYVDGDIVWVKFHNLWWPGEVYGESRWPPGLINSFRRLPVAVVKFFQENAYEYVKTINEIYRYNCIRKHEFIKKGLDLYRSKKRQNMEKFPEDVCTAEVKTGGDPNIIRSEEFQPQSRPNIASIFGDQTPKLKKGKVGRKKTTSPEETDLSYSRSAKKVTPMKSDYITYASPKAYKSPSTTHKTPPSAAGSSGADYKCHLCNFSTNRLNVIVLHNKIHSSEKKNIAELSVIGKRRATPIRKTPIKTKPIQRTAKQSFIETIISDEYDDDDEDDNDDDDDDNENIRGIVLNVTPSTSRGRKPLKTPPKKRQSKKIIGSTIVTTTVALPSATVQSKKNVFDTSLEKRVKPAEIKTSLLADWCEDEDDDESDLEMVNMIKIPESAATNENIDKSPVQESPPTSSVSDEKSTAATPKPVIRNIPKKDRRGIILDEFYQNQLPGNSSSNTVDSAVIVLDSDDESDTESRKNHAMGDDGGEEDKNSPRKTRIDDDDFDNKDNLSDDQVDETINESDETKEKEFDLNETSSDECMVIENDAIVETHEKNSIAENMESIDEIEPIEIVEGKTDDKNKNQIESESVQAENQSPTPDKENTDEDDSLLLKQSANLLEETNLLHKNIETVGIIGKKRRLLNKHKNDESIDSVDLPHDDDKAIDNEKHIDEIDKSIDVIASDADIESVKDIEKPIDSDVVGVEVEKERETETKTEKQDERIETIVCESVENVLEIDETSLVLEVVEPKLSQEISDSTEKSVEIRTEDEKSIIADDETKALDVTEPPKIIQIEEKVSRRRSRQKTKSSSTEKQTNKLNANKSNANEPVVCEPETTDNEVTIISNETNEDAEIQKNLNESDAVIKANTTDEIKEAPIIIKLTETKESDHQQELEIKNIADIQSTVEIVEELNDSESSAVQSSPSKQDTKDSSKSDVDCFDFKEEEEEEVPKTLNRRKRRCLPPGKRFELETIDKLEEIRKIEEEKAIRLRLEKEEKEKKQLKNDTITTVDIVATETTQSIKNDTIEENQSLDKGSEKSIKEEELKDNRTLPPKERGKRIFKSRNRSRLSEGESFSNDEKQTLKETSQSIDSLDEQITDNSINGSPTKQKISESFEEQPVIIIEKINSPEKIEVDPIINDDKQPIVEEHIIINDPIESEIANTLINLPLTSQMLTSNNLTSTDESDVNNEIQKVSKKRSLGGSDSDESKAKMMKPIKMTFALSSGKNDRQTVRIVKKDETVTTVASQISTIPKPKMKTYASISPSGQILSIQKCPVVDLPANTTNKSIENSTKTTIIFSKQKMEPSDSSQPSKKRKSSHPSDEERIDNDCIPAFIIDKNSKTTVITKKVSNQTGIITASDIQNMPIVLSDDNSLMLENEQNDNETSNNNSTTIVMNALIENPPTNNETSVSDISTPPLVKSPPIAVNTPAKMQLTPEPKKRGSRKSNSNSGKVLVKIGYDIQGNPITVFRKPPTNPVVHLPSHIQTPDRMIQPVSNSPTFTSTKGQFVQTSSQQIVITSKGTLITTSTTTDTSPITTSASVSASRSGTSNICSTSTGSGYSTPIKSPSKIQVQSQKIICRADSSSRHVTQQKQQQQQAQNAMLLAQNEEIIRQKQLVEDLQKRGFIIGEQQSSNETKIQATKPKTKQTTSLAALGQNNVSNAVEAAMKAAKITAKSNRVTKKQQSITAKKQQEAVEAAAILAAQQEAEKTTEITSNLQDNQLLAIPAENFDGPPGAFYLCTAENNTYFPIDRQPLYLDDKNQLIPGPGATGPMNVAAVQEDIVDDGSSQVGHTVQEHGFEYCATQEQTGVNLPNLEDPSNLTYLINTGDGQQILLDQQSMLQLTAGGEMPQLITADGQQLILQGSPQDILAAITSNQQELGLVGAGAGQQIIIPEDMAVIEEDGNNHDILAAALADTEVFQQDQYMGGDVLQIQTGNNIETAEPGVLAFQTINQAATSETNAILPPIMSTLEQPSKTDGLSPNVDCANLDESLAVIGVSTQPTNVPTSLELPITITNPAIAPKTTNVMTNIYPNLTSTIPASGASTAVARLTTASQLSPSIPIATEQDFGYELFNSSTLPISSSVIEATTTNHGNADDKDEDEKETGTVMTIVDAAAGTVHIQGDGEDGEQDAVSMDLDSNSEIIPNTPESVTYQPTTPELTGFTSDNSNSCEIPLQSNLILRPPSSTDDYNQQQQQQQQQQQHHINDDDLQNTQPHHLHSHQHQQHQTNQPEDATNAIILNENSFESSNDANAAAMLIVSNANHEYQTMEHTNHNDQHQSHNIPDGNGNEYENNGNNHTDALNDQHPYIVEEHSVSNNAFDDDNYNSKFQPYSI